MKQGRRNWCKTKKRKERNNEKRGEGVAVEKNLVCVCRLST